MYIPIFVYIMRYFDLVPLVTLQNVKNIRRRVLPLVKDQHTSIQLY